MPQCGLGREESARQEREGLGAEDAPERPELRERMVGWVGVRIDGSRTFDQTLANDAKPAPNVRRPTGSRIECFLSDNGKRCQTRPVLLKWVTGGGRIREGGIPSQGEGVRSLDQPDRSGPGPALARVMV